MKFIYALIVLPLLIPTFAFAEEVTTPEEMYTAVCQPNAEFTRELEKKDTDLPKLRRQFLKFLANPTPTVNLLKNSSLLQRGTGLEALGPLFLFASTCSMAEILNEQIEAKGCLDSSGRSYSSKNATALCAPLAAELKRQQEEDAKEEPKN